MSEKEYREFMFKKVETVKTLDGLLSILKEISEYNHDYGTCVIGAAAGMKATFNYLNRTSLGGGITGFQAGCLGWEMIREFMSISGPARLIDYENMLYPQYESKFEKVISKDIWEDLKKKAVSNLANTSAHPNVIAHWKSISKGTVPFGYSVKEDI